MEIRPFNRRQFLKGSIAAGTAFSSLPLLGVLPARRYRTALIGAGWWGRNVLRSAVESGACEIVALCDVDDERLRDADEQVRKLCADSPKRYRDYRELLDATRPEIVIIATPDHWHALCAIAAIEAGAHVWLEKPVGHTIVEGRAVVAAACKHDRIVQVGLHRRASPHNISAMQFLRSGKVGTIGMVRAFVHYPGGRGRKTPDSEPPPGLDWNLWCGPAPCRSFNSSIHPGGFRRHLDFANGQLGDWGVHWLDQILWWSDEKYPRRVDSTGGRHIKRDSTDAPDTQVAMYEFESFTATWEHRWYAANEAEKSNVGCYFYGTKGTLHLGWLDGWTFYPSNRKKSPIHQKPHLEEPDKQNIRGLWADFLVCIRTGARPICDIESGHRSTNLSLLGMLAYKLGRSVRWDGRNERVVDDDEANALLRREYRAPWKYPEVDTLTPGSGSPRRASG